MEKEALNSLRQIRSNLKISLSKIERDISMLSDGKKRILFLTPHLSTGGMPQYLLKKIEIFNEVYDVYCVQYENNAEFYNVQRNKIRDLLGEKFYCLGENKEKIFELIENISPDVIHSEDFVEYYLPENIIEKLFHVDRPYFIVETCHSSNCSIYDKKWVPDKFVMVNQFMVEKFTGFGVPLDILEYPIENNHRPNRDQALLELGLDPSKKHIVNVGLFTPGKNQGELINFAEKMLDFPVQFHFIGNTAPNFQDYWEPILEKIPTNCKIWGERRDIDFFYQCCDLFVFTSKFELNPIVIKESLSWKLPLFMRRLNSYLDQYDNNPLVHYFSETNSQEVDDALNIDMIKKLLQFNS